MDMQVFDLVVIGGGAAGLVSAITAYEEGIKKILILERESTLGGALNEYIHDGFGLDYYKESLTGTEFAQRLIDKIVNNKIEYKLNTSVMEMSEDKAITYINSKEGVVNIKSKAIIFAAGARERPRGAMNIPKSKCAGIFTAGSAQKFVNREGFLPGKEVVIMGSGDMGAIIARRLILEGAKVKAIVEYMPYVSASDKNIEACFGCFQIPILLSHKVIEIKGNERLEGLIVAEVDENKNPKPGTEEYIACDSLVISIGLYPENDLFKGTVIELSPITKGPIVNESMETSLEGIFVCGCALHVHNTVDEVAREAIIAAKSAVEYLKGIVYEDNIVKIMPSHGIKYAIPNHVNTKRLKEDLVISFKVDNMYSNKNLSVYFDDIKVSSEKRTRFSVGNMESIKLSKDLFREDMTVNKIKISLED
jgi:sarcosine oxidase subunit alpha